MFRLNKRAVCLAYAAALVAVCLVTYWVQGRMELLAELTIILGGAHPGLYLKPMVLWTLTTAAGIVVAIVVWIAARRSLRVALVISLAFPLAVLVFWWLIIERPLRLAV